jgi:autotransporter passenger strand-loop-strand repeat protein
MSNNLMGYCVMYLNPGASASNIDVGPATHLSIFSGAVATDIVENGGNVDVAEGATVTFASNTFGNIGSDISKVTIHSNTTLSGIVLQGYPGWPISCMVYGGTVKDTEITADYMYVSDGYMSNVTISGGYRVQLVGSRLTVSDITFRSGYTYLEEGSFTNIHVSTWTLVSGDVHINGAECAGFLQLVSGTISNLNIDSTCTVLVNTDGIVSNVNIYTGGMVCSQGCTVNSVTIHENGQLTVLPSATVSNIVIKSNGELFVSSGASALNVISNTGGVISAHADAYITYA